MDVSFDRTNNNYNYLREDDPENSYLTNNKTSFGIEIPLKLDIDNKAQLVKIVEFEKNKNNEEEALTGNSKLNKIKRVGKILKKYFNKFFCNEFTKFLYGLILTILWIYFYVLSLKGCEEQQAICLKNQSYSDVIILGKILFTSAGVLFLLNVFILFKFTQKHWLIISLIIMYYLFYWYDTGADLAHHGSYNRVFFYLFLAIFTFTSLTIYIFFRSLINYPIKTILITALSIFIIYTKMNNFIYTSCNYWDKGFKDSKILNESNHCKIFTPHTCFLKITDNLFDVTALRGLNCAKDRNLWEEKNLLKKYLPDEFKDTKRLGFPRTETWNFFPESTLEFFNKNIFKSMIDMDKKDEEIPGGKISEKNKIIDDTEVYIDFSKENELPEVVIKVKKNETLIKERTEILEKNKNETLFKNVIFIYLDALSRNHFRRKLKKTFAWLEQFYDNSKWEEKNFSEDNNQKFKDINSENKHNKKKDETENIYENYSSYQFFKYHAVDFYTYANMIPGYFGVHKFDKYGTYYLYDYKKAGYVTGQSTNVCEREGWDLEMAFQPYLDYAKYDHEFNAFYCDPNFSDPDSPYQFLKGAYSVIRKCMYGKDSGEFQIEYAKQFFDTYKDQNKVYRMIFSDAHEGTLEVVKYLDDMIHDFFEYLLVKGHLENSILLVMSDHGLSLLGPAYLSQSRDWFNEVFLPSLFFVIPKNHENFKQIDETLKKNENKWITSFDINSSLRSFANKTNTFTEYGQSLAMEELNEDYRSCNFYRMKYEFCLCNMEF